MYTTSDIQVVLKIPVFSALRNTYPLVQRGIKLGDGVFVTKRFLYKDEDEKRRYEMQHKHKEQRYALKKVTHDGLPGGQWKSAQGLQHFAVLIITLCLQFNVQTARARNSSPAVRRKKITKWSYETSTQNSRHHSSAVKMCDPTYCRCAPMPISPVSLQHGTLKELELDRQLLIIISEEVNPPLKCDVQQKQGDTSTHTILLKVGQLWGIINTVLYHLMGHGDLMGQSISALPEHKLLSDFFPIHRGTGPVYCIKRWYKTVSGSMETRGLSEKCVHSPGSTDRGSGLSKLQSPRRVGRTRLRSNPALAGVSPDEALAVQSFSEQTQTQLCADHSDEHSITSKEPKESVNVSVTMWHASEQHLTAQAAAPQGLGSAEIGASREDEQTRPESGVRESEMKITDLVRGRDTAD
ncbi:hypothetical protein DFH08DRAFT_824222 [Mycena albidolilacea]|uniref:Uncharacterized protein n=1 Tax=Mycena albidolilacea TaxID=1033008 RepID=A0AAD6Z587_9AGAR|nr:hypothetical protein DFH08DRAFT_824222 [Mycena albidolilacea]